MGATSKTVIDEARNVVAKLAKTVAEKTLKIIDKDDDELHAAMSCNFADAPLWAHVLKSLSVSVVKAQLSEGTTTDNSLNITIVGSASSKEEWLEMAKPFTKQIEEKKEIIDVDVLQKDFSGVKK
jgi:hypothetical protein